MFCRFCSCTMSQFSLKNSQKYRCRYNRFKFMLHLSRPRNRKPDELWYTGDAWKSLQLTDPVSHFYAVNLSWFCVYRFATWIMDVTTSSECLLPIWQVLENPLKRVKPSCVRSGQCQSQVERDCPLKNNYYYYSGNYE